MANTTSGTRKTYALVVMTNNDKYFITLSERDRLETALHQLHKPLYFETIDAKNYSKLQLFVEHISSVVVEG